MDTLLENRYFDWMVEKIGGRRGYESLLRFLFYTPFVYSMPMDGNRYEDGIDLLHDVSAAVHNFLHDMGLIIVAAVQERTIGRCELQHRHVETLSERTGGDFDVTEPFFIIDQSARIRFARMVDAGFLSEIENLLVAAEGLRPDLLSDLDKADVAGTAQSFHRRQRSAGGIHVAVNAVVADGDITGPVLINIVPVNNTFFDSGCERQGFCSRAGLVGAADAVIQLNEEFGASMFVLDIYGRVEDGQAKWFNSLLAQAPDYINYCGMVQSNQSTEVLKDAFALLFPTFYEGEGFAGTLIDAMAAGVPVIASDWRYNSEIVENGVTGYLFNTHDVDKMKELLLLAKKNTDEWKQMRLNCICKAKQFLTSSVINVLIERLDI